MVKKDCTMKLCKEGCCNYYGTCPNKYSSSTKRSRCYTYYSNTNQKSISNSSVDEPLWIIGLVLGIFVVVIAIIAIKFYINRKKR